MDAAFRPVPVLVLIVVVSIEIGVDVSPDMKLIFVLIFFTRLLGFAHLVLKFTERYFTVNIFFYVKNVVDTLILDIVSLFSSSDILDLVLRTKNC